MQGNFDIRLENLSAMLNWSKEKQDYMVSAGQIPLKRDAYGNFWTDRYTLAWFKNHGVTGPGLSETKKKL